MIHGLIIGVTQSGKTTLAHSMAKEFARKGQAVIVFDPLGTPTAANSWPESAIVFNDKAPFLAYMAREDVSHAHVFIDEAYEIFRHGDPDNYWLLTRGRHYGFQCFLISQRPTMLPPSVRTQCGVAFMFRLAKHDAKEICADFGHDYPAILETSHITEEGSNEPESDKKVIKPLDKGDYIVLNSGSATFSRANIFDQLNEGNRRA
jgi:DNA helicase HerA-like ATPase